MITIEELTWQNVPTYVAWCFAVWAVANALFRSMIGESITSWLQFHSTNTRLISRRYWELKNNKVLTPRTGDMMASQRPLTTEERTQRLVEIKRLRWRTLPHRLATYLMSCSFCQYIWTAFGLLLIFGNGSISTTIVSTFAYAGIVTLCGMVNTSTQQPSQRSTPCGGK